MFGFLRIARARLTDDDRAAYRAHFCGTCHALRAFGGRPASLLTNYDATVFTLVLASLAPAVRTRGKPCTAVPFRTVGVHPIPAPVAEFSAAFTIALTDAKLEDDVADEGHWWARAARRALRGRALRARAALVSAGYDVGLLDRLGPGQRDRERRAAAGEPGAADWNTLSSATADALGAAFARGAALAGRHESIDMVERIGRSLARFVYTADAIEDRTADRRNGRFNAVDVFVAAGGAEADAFAFARAELEILRRRFDGLPPGPQQRILASLHATLVTRLASREAASTAGPSTARLAAQRGDCDCGVCDCGGCGGDSSCCCPDAMCDCLCCWDDRRRRRNSG